MTVNSIKYLAFVIFSIVILIVPHSCAEEEVELSRANKIQADSIFRVREKALIIEIDSLCALVYGDTFERAKDSIAGVRLKEIEEINSR